MGIDHNVMLTDIGKEEPLTEAEKAIRDLFVDEYLKDHDPISAARRCGFIEIVVKEYALAFMQEPYVHRALSEAAHATPINDEDEIQKAKRKIKAGLFDQAFYYGPGSSHAARVSALSNLAQYYGISTDLQPKKADNGAVRGGVMQVPGLIGLTDWEKASKESQEQLQRDVRN